MFTFLVRRLIVLSVVVFGASFGTYALFYHSTEYVPIVMGYCGSVDDRGCDPEIYQRLLEIYGFERPILVQFADYVCGGLCVPDARREGIVKGDWGTPARSKRDIADIIKAGLPISVQLGLAALVVLYAVGTTLGALARIHRRRALGTALEEARGCPHESGIMVL